jgi:hypothetical protein
MSVKRLGAFPFTMCTGVWIGAHTTLRAPFSNDMRSPELLTPRCALARLVYACGSGQLSRAEMPQDVFPTIDRHIIGYMASIEAAFIPETATQVVCWTYDIKGTYDRPYHILVLHGQAAVKGDTQKDFGDHKCTIVDFYPWGPQLRTFVRIRRPGEHRRCAWPFSRRPGPSRRYLLP